MVNAVKDNEQINNDIYIKQGDCLELMKEIPDKYVDLIVTDPPYKTTSRGNAGNSGGMCQKDEFMKGRVFKYNNIKCNKYIPQCYRILKEGTHFYIMTNHINLHEMLNTCKAAGFRFIKTLIWNKGNKVMGQCYMSQFEYILFYRKGKHKKINNCGTSDILSIPNKKQKDENGENLHNTEKPYKLMQILIENSTQKNDIIFDPFMGIGSAAIACMNINRKFIGFEIDENYFNIAVNRIEQFRKAVG